VTAVLDAVEEKRSAALAVRSEEVVHPV